MSYRILVTGSRDWGKPDLVYDALGTVWDHVGHDDITVVHGDCPSGADAQAALWARTFAFPYLTEEAHPADWNTYGKAAGFRRNAEMVAAGADICLAFIREHSKGASHTANLAAAHGIPVVSFLDCDCHRDTQPADPTSVA